jgi:DNA polymerase (family 10)
LPDLVTGSDILGRVHAHTTASDGVNSLREMAGAVHKRGYAYFGVADHSRSAHYAGGLNVEEINVQHAAIDELNRDYDDRSRIFKGNRIRYSARRVTRLFR